MVLRRSLLYLSQANWARRVVARFWLARRVARRFVAGETLDEAITLTRSLNEQGLLVTLDYLGESVDNAADTEDVIRTYLTLVDCIHQNGLQASLSLKLTHLGLDVSEDLCLENLRRVLSAAKQYNILITIDMESSAYTDRTLRIYRTMRDEHGFDNVGTVIQSALRRSGDDMRQLMAEGARIRLCKGAYLEPPQIAYPEKIDVDRAFVQIMDEALQAPPPAYLEIATHDEAMITAATEIARRCTVPPERYEFQMLYGIREARQTELADTGYKMRAYVPFGTAWYPYFMRRLAERPANLWFFVRSLFSR
jgi:proline dehydrogenase